MPETLKRQSSDYCLALQPICDQHLRHVGDELLYRSSQHARSAQIEDPLVATARVSHMAFYEMGVEALTGHRQLFFNVPREWLFNPDLLPPVTERVVLEILEDIAGDAEVIEALQQIKSLGYCIALDDFVVTQATLPLLDVADIVKVDVLNDGIRDADLAIYQSRGLTLLAEKVEDFKTFQHCRDLGFTLFQGYFYAHPEIRPSQFNRNGNKTAQLRLLAVLQDENAEFEVLEPLLAQDPQLCIRLLRLCNSPLYRRECVIASLRQAMILVGFSRLRKLIVVVMLADSNPFNQLMLPKALTRASMCEKLAEETHADSPDSAFLVGILSMMDILLEEPLDKLCVQLPLSEEVKLALLKRQGRLGEILRLTIAFEEARLGTASQAVVERLNRCYLSSVCWANQLLGEVSRPVDQKS